MFPNLERAMFLHHVLLCEYLNNYHENEDFQRINSFGCDVQLVTGWQLRYLLPIIYNRI